MKIVSLEWFEQSLERGMVLDEARYNPTMPVEQRGQGAWDRREFPSPAAGKRARETEQSQALNPFRRKLRRSASTKMGSQSEALWAGITAVSLERQHDDRDDWTEGILHNQNTPQEHTPTMRAQDAKTSVADVSSDADPACDPHQPPVRSIPLNSNVATGLFEGRIVFPHGFDEEKVVAPRAWFQALLIPIDKHPTTASAGPRCTSSAEYRAQYFFL
jgi:DNA replication regulator DPB11